VLAGCTEFPIPAPSEGGFSISICVRGEGLMLKVDFCRGRCLESGNATRADGGGAGNETFGGY